MINATSSIWTMVLGTGPVVQFVLISLILFSIGCWTVIFAKIRRFRQAKIKNEEFERIFWESSSLSQVRASAQAMIDAPMAGVFLAGHDELRRLKERTRPQNITVGLKVWLDTLERSLHKGIKEELAALERMLPFLATTGNAAPFIGLFGTVWGIMNSFHSIGLKGSANLATVAPGISEALVATAAGLAAAIPAVIAFNSFMSIISRMEAEL